MIISRESTYAFFYRCDIDKTVKNVGMYTDYAINKTRNVTLLEDLPSSESGVLLWTCLVESTIKHKYVSNSQWIINIIMWPIKQNITSNVSKNIYMNFLPNHISIIHKHNKAFIGYILKYLHTLLQRDKPK